MENKINVTINEPIKVLFSMLENGDYFIRIEEKTTESHSKKKGSKADILSEDEEPKKSKTATMYQIMDKRDYHTDEVIVSKVAICHNADTLRSWSVCSVAGERINEIWNSGDFTGDEMLLPRNVKVKLKPHVSFTYATDDDKRSVCMHTVEAETTCVEWIKQGEYFVSVNKKDTNIYQFVEKQKYGYEIIVYDGDLKYLRHALIKKGCYKRVIRMNSELEITM